MPSVLRSAPLIAALLCLAGCEDSTKPITVASVTIEPTPTTMIVGTTLQLRASTRDADNNILTDRVIAWTSYNTATATVSASGLVRAIGPGQVVIAATSEGQGATITITSQPGVAFVLVSAPKTILGLGELTQLRVRLEDANHAVLTGRDVTWSSSGAAATVSSTGLVTGVTLGSTTIMAVSEGQLGAIVITVAGPVASVGVTPEASSIRLGGTAQLSAISKDANGTPLPGRTATWSSSNEVVASVSAEGVVTALHAGQSTISATVDGKSGSATVTVPAPVHLATTAIGMSHSCALDTDSHAYCWGDNSDGQVGDGTFEGRTMPTAVATTVTFSAVTAGSSHNCALTSDGAAYCWGAGTVGQLGNGGTLTRATPGRVSGSLAFVSISAGAYHTCALIATGAAYCWGANESGQLGDGTRVAHSTPIAVAGSATFVSISAGGQHTCGLATTGSVYCWGANAAGQLGDGTMTAHNVPTSISGGPFASLSAGSSHTCAVATDGAAYCWGENRYGQLGNGTTSSRPAPNAVSGGRSFAAISAGTYHTCGVTTAGAAYCWGSNDSGELGTGTGSSSTVLPVAVLGGLTFSSISATSGSLSSDYYYYYYYAPTGHSCGVTTDRLLYCWGDNTRGQLGNPGAGVVSSLPVKVTGQ
jgi:alpha-tubulin suppressor-like RCC1 family protein/uncharacterized protein YjdB